VPCGAFGDTAVAETDEMLNEFDSFVSSDDFNDSSEFIVFGNDPLFSEIFYPTSPVLDFWKSHQALLDLPDSDRAKVYIVS